jgi:hypothetical protein
MCDRARNEVHGLDKGILAAWTEGAQAVLDFQRFDGCHRSVEELPGRCTIEETDTNRTE